MNWRKLFGPCAFGHASALMGRNAAQQAVWTCSRCQVELGPVLGSEVKDGPRKHQGDVLGQPTGKATRIKKDNVTPFERQSSR